MTWSVNLSGHDDLSGEAKAEFENGLVDDLRLFVDDLKAKEGVNVTWATVATNTTDSVDLLKVDDADEVAADDSNADDSNVE